MRAFGHFSGTPLEHAKRLVQVERELGNLLREFEEIRDEVSNRKRRSRDATGAALSAVIWWGRYVEARDVVVVVPIRKDLRRGAQAAEEWLLKAR